MRPRGPQPGWTVLVTGASSGLGRSLALELAELGCGLILTGRSEARLQGVAAEALACGAPEVRTVTADLGVPGGVEHLAAALESGWPDALVNNAGAGRSGPWSHTNDADRDLLRLLVDAPLTLTKTLLPRWKEKGRGALMNIASTGSFQPGPETAVYYAAKAFLSSWSLALASEEGSWLTVTTVCPGAMRTGFSERAGKRDVPGAPLPGGVARRAVKAWRQGRGLVIPGWGNRALVFASRLLPPSWVASAVRALQRSLRE